jgi:hypothetical protein
MTKSIMMMWSKLGFFVALIYSFYACSPKIVKLTDKEKEANKKTEELVSKLDSLNKAKPTYFYGKAATTFKDKKNNVSFKTSLKINSDSAATALITFAGLPIFNAIATKDSVKFQNKREKCYAENSIDFFKNAFGYPFEFENIVQLLLGLPITFEKGNEFVQIPDNIFHVLSTHKRIRLKTGAKMYAPDDASSDEIFIKYFLTQDGNTLEKVEIENPSDKVKVIVTYGNRSKDAATLNYPQLIVAKIITENNKIDVSLEFESIEINQKQELYYTVPASYVICK